MSRPGVADPGLVDYLAILWRRRSVVLLCVGVVVGVAALAAARETPRYRAEATVLSRLALGDRVRLLASTKASTAVIDRLLANEVVLARSDAVAGQAAAAYGAPFAVDVAGGTTSDTIVVRAEAASAADAALRANTYAEAFVRVRTEVLTDQATAGVGSAERERDEILAALDAGANPAVYTGRLAALDGELATGRAALAALAAGGPGTPGPAQLARAATPPSGPFEPAWGRTLLLAVVLGLTIGAGAGFVVDALAGPSRPRPAGARRSGSESVDLMLAGGRSRGGSRRTGPADRRRPAPPLLPDPAQVGGPAPGAGTETGAGAPPTAGVVPAADAAADPAAGRAGDDT